MMFIFCLIIYIYEVKIGLLLDEIRVAALCVGDVPARGGASSAGF